MKKIITLSVLSTIFLVTAYQRTSAASSSAAQGRILQQLPPLKLVQTCIDFAHNMRGRPKLSAMGQLTYNMMMQACKSLLAYEQHNAHQAYLENIEAADTFFEMAERNQKLGLSNEARTALEKGRETEAQIRRELEHDPRQASGTFVSYFEYASYALDMANGHGNPHNLERNKKSQNWQHHPRTWQWGHFSQNDIDGEWTSYHEQHYVASMDHARRGMHDSLVNPRQ